MWWLTITKIALAVLAGGTSSRLGGAFKPLLKVCGESLLVRVLRELGGLADEVIVSIRGPEQLSALPRLPRDDVKFVMDIMRVKSPLAGMYSALLAAEGDLVLIAPCDMPFLTSKVYEALMSRLSDRDAAIPDWRDGRLEPLVCVCRRAPTLRAVIETLVSGEMRVARVYSRLRTAFVAVRELTEAPEVVFTNVNDGLDLAEAQRICSGRMGGAAAPCT